MAQNVLHEQVLELDLIISLPGGVTELEKERIENAIIDMVNKQGGSVAGSFHLTDNVLESGLI